MAHFAKLDENNVVIDMVVINNEELLDENGIEQEALGVAFCKNLYGQDTNWIQTSYNANIRWKYAAVGDTYDSTTDRFIPPKPAEYPSWVLTENRTWEPPVPYPSSDEPVLSRPKYDWDEATLSWVLVS